MKGHLQRLREGHFYGDIHNHNGLGYGKGSLERSLDIATEHLDFFAFTGHSSWHDMVPMEGGREAHWQQGFERLRSAWPHVQGLTAEANKEGAFAAFLGFEWHSSKWGDQCVVFPGDFENVCYATNLADLRTFCLQREALMIPHHIAYPSGNRGMNWKAWTPECSPVVEIYSEHGNSEDDRGLFPYFNHSMGGRLFSNTAIPALQCGHRFGFVASSDNHRGFPGAHGEGLLGVVAENLSRAAILKAVRQRRTYALTGDRFAVDFKGDGHWMGSAVRCGKELALEWDVLGSDELDSIELIADGHCIHRSEILQDYRVDESPTVAGNLRFEWGWGPWGDLSLERITDWEFDITIRNGRLSRYSPCLQSGPFSEERRHRIEWIDSTHLRVSSYTSRQEAYRQNPNQSMVLGIEGSPDTVVEINYTKPDRARFTHKLSDLQLSGDWNPMGPFPKESALWHRLVPKAALQSKGHFNYPVEASSGYVYLRARQRNGQMAWASPIFYDTSTT